MKYTASVLGAVWSLLNPVVFLAVFSFVVHVLHGQVPDFPVYLLSGLLAWNLFSSSLTTGARSVVDNANLVKKVAFPREILPLSAVGVGIVDFVLQSSVLVLFIVVSGHEGLGAQTLVLYPLSIVTLVVFSTTMVFLVSALNVRYRDIQHLVGLGLLVWFWMTPIVYPAALVEAQLAGKTVAGVSLWHLYFVNPMTSIISGFQRALYGEVSPDRVPVLPDVPVGWVVAVVAVTLVASVALLYAAWRLFFRLSGDFAEEL